MKHLVAILALLLSTSVGLFAQPIFEDANGVSTILLPSNPAFSMNTGSGEIDFQMGESNPETRLSWGVKAGGVPELNPLRFLRSGDIKPGGNIGGFLCFSEIGNNRDEDSTSSWTNWLGFQANLGVERLDFYNPNLDFAQQLSDTIASNLSIRSTMHFLLNGKTLFAFSAGYLYTHNYNSLPQIEIGSSFPAYDSIASQLQAAGWDEPKGAQGELLFQGAVSFSADVIHFFGENDERQLAVHGYLRNHIQGGIYNLSPGVNLNLLKNQKGQSIITLPVLFGVNLEYQDALNSFPGSSNFWDHLQGSITLGVKITDN